MELWIPPQASLQIMWFLCGSTWFQQCQNAGTCLFRIGQTLKNNVVPMWFHVVPTMMIWIPPQISLRFMWFLCGSTWFQQCRGAGTCLSPSGQMHRNSVVPRGSNNDDVNSAPDFLSNHVVPVWFNVVPTMPKRAPCSHQRNPSRLAADRCWTLAAR